MATETEPADMPSESEAAIGGIDREALKQLDAEIEARQRAGAEKHPLIKKAELEPASVAPSIREFLNSASIKSGHARILELCQKYEIDIDKNPWPPRFP